MTTTTETVKAYITETKGRASNRTIKHHGVRNVRNLRTIFTDNSALIGEATVAGRTVHVCFSDLPHYDRKAGKCIKAAHVLSRDAWEFVYGPADERSN